MTSDLMTVAEDSVRGSFFLASGAFAATVINAVTAIIVARFLGSELYGQYALSLVLAQLLFTFAGFGIAQGVIKFAASLRAEGKNTQATKIIKYAVLLRALIGIPFFLLNFALADFFAATLFNRPELGFYLRIASLSIFFQVVATTATSAFLGLDKTEYSALTNNIQAVSKAIISITLVLLGFSVAGAVLGHVAGWIIGSAIGVAILFFILRKRGNPSDSEVGFSESFKTLTSYGLPLYGATILVGFIQPYQNLILGIFASNVAIGNWKAASNFIALIAVVSMPITTALFPAFSKLNSHKNEETKTFFKFANKYTTLLIVPFTMLLIIFSKEIVQTVYGGTYQSAAFFLSIYCLLYFLVGLGYLNLTSLFNGLGKTRITLKIGSITFITVLALSPILATTYGVPGVITALITAQGLGTCYGMYTAKTKFQIQYDTKSIIKIYIIGAVSTIPPLLLLQFSPLPKLANIILGGLLYLATYITLTPITKIMNNAELQTAAQILQKIKPLAPIIKPLVKYQEKILNRKQPTTTIPQA